MWPHAISNNIVRPLYVLDIQIILLKQQVPLIKALILKFDLVKKKYQG